MKKKYLPMMINSKRVKHTNILTKLKILIFHLHKTEKETEILTKNLKNQRKK